MNEYREHVVDPTDIATESESNMDRVFQRRALTFMAFINVGMWYLARDVCFNSRNY